MAIDETKRCPRCGLTNTGTALRCDCGWDFKSQTTARSYVQGALSPAERKKRATDQIFAGTLLIVAGIVLTALTYQSSNGGGVIFYGAIIVGVIKVFRGLAAG
jgi:hypothetical protein